MDLFDFADVRSFRVRLPTRLYPYQGHECVEACDEIMKTELGDHSDQTEPVSGWLGISDLAQLFPAKFSEKNPLNIPGPIYGAATDTCCTGPQEAPENVLLDKSGQEFLFKQASNAGEFRDLVSAARCECFEGYGADGDAYWRLSTIRDWWGTREDMLREGIGEKWCKPESCEKWKRALQGNAMGYLRVYAYFVENDRIPVDGDVLPDL